MKKRSTTTIGIDLGDKFSHFCFLDDAGSVSRERRILTSRESFTALLKKEERSRIVFEVGTHSRWVAEIAEALGHDVVVANARQVALIYGNTTKNDRTDAELLARLGRVDAKLLAPIKHRAAATQADLAVLQSRDMLVRIRTKLVSHARGIVKAAGHRLPKCVADSFHKKVFDSIPETLKPALDPIVACVEAISEQIKDYDRDLEGRVHDAHPEVKRVEQVKGVGTLTALAFVLTIEDPKRFRKSRDVGPYLGLVPRQDQSGDSNKQLRITKAGNGFVRKLLVNCSHHILGPFGPDTDLREWGLSLASRGGKNSKKRAVIAVARKLATILHRLWVTGETYVPTGYVRAGE
jgi:transposase